MKKNFRNFQWKMFLTPPLWHCDVIYGNSSEIRYICVDSTTHNRIMRSEKNWFSVYYKLEFDRNKNKKVKKGFLAKRKNSWNLLKYFYIFQLNCTSKYVCKYQKVEIQTEWFIMTRWVYLTNCTGSFTESFCRI